VGTNGSVTVLEDANYVFKVADFGFSDPNDNPANSLLAVQIVSLPAAGSLTLNGVAVVAGQFVSVSAINAGSLVFRPARNENGAEYASFTFRVQDDGGTANGGVNLDLIARTMTIHVTSVNDAPRGQNGRVTVLEDGAYRFTLADFEFADLNDSPANSLAAIQISSVPGAGRLTLNGVAVTAGQFVTATQIANGALVYTPAANGQGDAYANFTFRVRDNGGTANGGIDLDPVARRMRIDVTSVNDAPRGFNSAITATAGRAFTFTTLSFGFSDPNDRPADNLMAVQISTLPARGRLLLDGVAIKAGQFVSIRDIRRGRLTYTPPAGAVGTAYAAFTFRVQDDGGTANGGVDLDIQARTMTINVAAATRGNTPAAIALGPGSLSEQLTAMLAQVDNSLAAWNNFDLQQLIESLQRGARN
jgi:Bacterial Ig domain